MTDMDRFIEAADAAIRQAEHQCDNIAFVLNHATMPDHWYHKMTDELATARVALTEYRAAREAITKGTPPAFATSA